MQMAKNHDTAGTRQGSLKGIKVGVVCSDRRDKTRTVIVTYQVKHSKYGKFMKRRTRYHVHDSNNASQVGDQVEIVNCRRISKTKSWRLLRVVVSAKGAMEHDTSSSG